MPEDGQHPGLGERALGVHVRHRAAGDRGLDDRDVSRLLGAVVVGVERLPRDLLGGLDAHLVGPDGPSHGAHSASSARARTTTFLASSTLKPFRSSGRAASELSLGGALECALGGRGSAQLRLGGLRAPGHVCDPAQRNPDVADHAAGGRSSAAATETTANANDARSRTLR